MGFMNVLKFSAACFDLLLGWPLFAVGYPLCASIWVIETKSISDIRKLVTYWVLFSLITLFEDAFANLLEWIPFWPCIKLMLICWLVIPHFDGSYYVYQHLVHPGLSMDPQVVMNQRFNESKKLYHSKENFLVAADRYIKENGAEALEKLLASKLRSTKPNVEVKKIKAPAPPEKKGEQESTLMEADPQRNVAHWWKCEEPNVAQEEIPVVEVTEIKNVGDGAIRCEGPNSVKKGIKVTEVTQRTFSGTAQWVKQTEINLGETKSNTTCAAEIKERAAEVEACLHKKVQKEWACAVCQVTTQSEATFNSHLQGKRHKVTSKQLKAKKQATKISGSPPVSMAKKFDQSTKEEQPKCTSYNLKSKNSGISAASTVKNPDETRHDERQKCGSNNGPNEKNNKKQEEKALVPETSEQGHQNLKQNGDGMKELGSRCNICYVSCTSELDMTSHLNGRRHFNRVKQLSKLWCSNCNVKCNSEADMASHPNGRRHLKQLKKRSRLWCSICRVSCNSKVSMNSHLNGRRHLDQIKETVRIMMPHILWQIVQRVLWRMQQRMQGNLICNGELSLASSEWEEAVREAEEYVIRMFLQT